MTVCRAINGKIFRNNKWGVKPYLYFGLFVFQPSAKDMYVIVPLQKNCSSYIYERERFVKQLFFKKNQ